ncbi:MAG: N-acetyl-gamma-glutamyl-phosphate reductase [Taibaiella sp.]|nr:N-acetyl-gamma-glutamyl-phosphate reductase [Taibaiella sp.]
MKKIKAGIIGGAGYTGGELIRLLLGHPAVELVFVHSRSNSGKAISVIHDDLEGLCELHFTDQVQLGIDVLFLCLGHGESRSFFAAHNIEDKVKIIDLTNDFRVDPDTGAGKRNFIYGLPEVNKELIKTADAIANPGCFATAIQLSLLPLLAQHKIPDIYITGITGSTGAGQALSRSSHFSWRQNNIQAYKTLVHQHLDEVSKTLSTVQHGLQKSSIHFVPWRGDFARGIFISTQVKVPFMLTEIKQWYKDFYSGHPFVHCSDRPIHLKQVVNTNRCLLQLEMEDDNLVIHVAIDNLLKGAVGQAVQNMNLMFDQEETTGLLLKASCF